MEARSERKVKDGKEFNHLFPPADVTDVTVKKNADVEDTLALIQKTVPQTLWHTKRIANELRGKTLDETCSNIWHFVYRYIKYKKDEDGVEQVRSPRRTWWERHSGVDCDCYMEFISSILLNLNIPHKARITKYPKRAPEIPRWQHIYPVVPKDGDLNNELSNRDDYIVIDCVKDDYDNEQRFLDYKDYDMKLNYLDGLDDERKEDYETIEAQSLADLHDDELGKISLKKAVTKIGTAVKAVAKKMPTPLKTVIKKVGDTAGKVIRVVNRVANPATILLRNGFLLAMKTNFLNVAGRLRYAYLTDAKAQQGGINPAAMKKLRAIKDRAETLYWQAGGLKENLKKGILEGKGNRDKKVPLSGLSGPDDDVYADMDEYNILMGTYGTEGLGVIAAAMAPAAGAVTALSVALKQITDLFRKNSGEANAFNSESEDSIVQQSVAPQTTQPSKTSLVKNAAKAVYQQARTFIPPVQIPAQTQQQEQAPESEVNTDQRPQPTEEPGNTTTTITANDYELPASNDVPAPKPATAFAPAKTGGSIATQKLPAPVNRQATTKQSQLPEPRPVEDPMDVVTPAQSPTPAKEGVIQKTTHWVKTNPGKSLLIAGVVAGSTYLVIKYLGSGSKQKNNNTQGLNGLVRRNSSGGGTSRKRKRKHRHQPVKKVIVETIKL